LYVGCAVLALAIRRSAINLWCKLALLASMLATFEHTTDLAEVEDPVGR
jgi:hypothetical protein